MNILFCQAQGNEAEFDSLIRLGVSYYVGKGKPKDYDKAFDTYTTAYNMGGKKVGWRLGLCYEYGHGVLSDSAKAFSFYKESAELNFTQGYNCMAQAYRTG